MVDCFPANVGWQTALGSPDLPLSLGLTPRCDRRGPPTDFAESQRVASDPGDNAARTQEHRRYRERGGQFHDLRHQPQVNGADRCTGREGPISRSLPRPPRRSRKLPSGAHESLLKDSAKLKAVLNHHIVSRHLLAKDVKPGEIMKLHGGTLTAVGSSADVRVNGARITQADIAATNGIVHGIDTVILPKTGNYWRLPPDSCLSLST